MNREPMRVTLLMPPSFGQLGGIAQYCRDLVSAIANDSTYGSVHSLAPKRRLVRGDVSLGYVEIDRRKPLTSLRAMIQRALYGADIVLCAHRDLLPLAYPLASMASRPIVLFAYGIEAWEPFTGAARCLLSTVTRIVCISKYTQDRMNAWALLPEGKYRVLPCAIDASRTSPGLTGRKRASAKVMVTIARLDSRERYKGIDEVLSVCPRLFTAFPMLHYVIVGDGSDRARLEQRACELGVSDRVTFLGSVAESKKLEVLRDADAFVMPGRGEGFGIVYLEAMACGVPVVASRCDGSREAVLFGRIGRMANPDCPEDIFQQIVGALRAPRQVPSDLDHFSLNRFRERLLSIIWDVLE